jgi:hypothetical protein
VQMKSPRSKDQDENAGAGLVKFRNINPTQIGAENLVIMTTARSPSFLFLVQRDLSVFELEVAFDPEQTLKTRERSGGGGQN